MKRILTAVVVLAALSGCVTPTAEPSSPAAGLFPTVTPGEAATQPPPTQASPATAQQQPAQPSPAVTALPGQPTFTPPPTFTPRPGQGPVVEPTATPPPPLGTAPRPTRFIPTRTAFPTATPLPPTLAPPAGPTLSPDTSGGRTELTGDEQAAAGTVIYGGTRCLLSVAQPACGCRPDALTVTFNFPDANKMRQITPSRDPERETSEITYSRIGFNAWRASLTTETGLDLTFTLEFRPNGFDQQVDATYPDGSVVSCVNRWNR